MVGRDVLFGLDPGVALMIAAAMLAVIGGIYAVFFWVVDRLGWAQ